MQMSPGLKSRHDTLFRFDHGFAKNEFADYNLKNKLAIIEYGLIIKF